MKLAKMISQLIVIVVVEAFHGRVLYGSVHAFNLAIGPGVFDLGQPMLNLMFAADAIKDVLECVNMPVMIGELNAVIGEDDVEPVGHGSDQVAQERSSGHLPGFWMQLDIDELRCPINGDEHVEFAFSRLHFRDVDVKIPERVGFELLLRRLVAIDLG